MTKSIHCYSPAKINLTLDVKSKKADAGFHEIETIYHRIRLVDEITITESDNFEVVGDFDCAMEDNLITKAFMLIRKYHPDCPNVRVEVIKNIPTKAGLGGGSSNFATFTKLYFKLFKLGTISPSLIQASGDIGKDIPFFFQDAPCGLGTNFGEVVQPLDFNFSNQEVYLYHPNFGNESKEAYTALTEFDTAFTQDFLSNPSLDKCGNTFDQLRTDKIDKTHLTGSGSVFYSFEDLGELKDCQKIKTTFL